MSDHILRSYVSIRTRIECVPDKVAAVLRNERGDQVVSTGMVVAASLVLGVGLIAAVKTLVLPWINQLLSTCLQGAGNGTTGTGCP